MKRTIHRGIAALLVLVLLLTGTASAMAEAVSRNPLLDPQPIEQYTRTPNRFFNVLLLGIDYGSEGNWGSGHKTVLDQCHTDAIMVVSINRDKRTISFVSIPRDTLTYVPGIQGIYKLNAAVNCAPNMEAGMENICAAVSWLLGGIKIDHYVAVDMTSMTALGDAIGGVDFNVDMDYTGTSGTKYHQGMQHLDGRGIMDYVRARKNATVDADDLGRTRRQRDLMIAIFKKVKSNPALINDVLDVIQDDNLNIFRNVHRSDLSTMLPGVLALNEGAIGSYVLTGPYRFALVDWSFTFTDQANRRDVIQTVYGVDVEDIPYVSYEYTKWLTDHGMLTARFIQLTRQVLAYARQMKALTPDQQTAVDALTAAHDAAVLTFDQAADTMTSRDINAMVDARRALREQADETAKIIGYPGEIPWHTSALWYDDPLINEYRPDWR